MSSAFLRWSIVLCCLALLTSASAHTASELPPVLAPNPASAAEAGPAPANHTNETHPPKNDSSHVPPPTLTPTRQNVSRPWDEAAPFEVVVGNPANATHTRTISLSGRAPSGWAFSLDATNVTLAPGESATVRGEVELQTPLLGDEGTVLLRASASNQTVLAYVDVCFRGLLQACGGNATTNGTSPPTNETQPPRNETQPPQNRTEPPSNETRAPPNGTRPPANETQASRPEEPQEPPAPRVAEVEVVVRARETDAVASLRL